MSTTLLLLILSYLPLTSSLHTPCFTHGPHTVCKLPQSLHHHPTPHIDHATTVDAHTSRPFTYPRFRRPSPRQAQRTTFNATLVGDTTPTRLRAIRYCMRLAEQQWPSSVKVDVLVDFRTLARPTMLGSASATSSWNVSGFICPVALASSILGVPANQQFGESDQFEISMTLNAAADWHEELDALPPPGLYDLVTVCLHEVVHGLFMSGYNLGVGGISDGSGRYSGFFLNPARSGRFEAFMANQDACNIVGYDGEPVQLGTVLTGNNLWFVSDKRVIAQLYAPRPYESGSSWYHLSESVYGQRGDVNDLMTPVIASAYAQHNFGDVIENMISELLDVGKRGADVCEQIGEPLIGNVTVVGGGGSEGDGGDGSNPLANFVIQLGDLRVNGWALIGGLIGALVVVLVVIAIVKSAVVKGNSSARRTASRPVRRLDLSSRGSGGANGGLR